MLGLRRASEAPIHHAITFPADHDAEFDDVFVQRRLVRDPTLYVSTSCATDPAQAPADAENWFVLVNAPSGRRLSRCDEDAYEAKLVDRLAVRERIVVSARRAPSDLERGSRAVGGAIYGAAPHGRLGTLRRPGPVVRGVRGLYRVGGTAHPGGGLPLVALSGRIVARLIGAP
jgi:phytoene dehydrogenase-like protein